eukprot:sb/3463865/
MKRKMAGEPSLLFKGFIASKNNPYNADTNPTGIINLGTSENLICSDLVIPKMESLAKFSPQDMTYFPRGGVTGFREELASFAEWVLGADQLCSATHQLIVFPSIEPPLTIMASERMRSLMKEKQCLLFNGHMTSKNNPYNSETNPAGIINLGTSENRICSDLVLPKINSLAKFIPEDLHYFPHRSCRGVPGFRQELAKFLTHRAKSDITLNHEHISITSGLSSAFCFLSFFVGRFPQSRSFQLVGSLSRFISRPLAIRIGSSPTNTTLTHTGEEGDQYLIGAPYYGMTQQYMGSYGGLTPIELPDGGSIDSMKSALQTPGHSIKAIVLLNPQNPTGEVYTKEYVLEVMGLAKAHSLHVIIDEIYFLSIFEGETFESCLSYTQEWPDPPRTHFIWSFSKDFSMSGARCGLIYSQSEVLHNAYNDKMAFYHFGTLYVWADFSPLFPDPDHPTSDQGNSIFYGLIDEGVYIPSSGGFNGPQPQFFRIVFAVPKQELLVAMERLAKFAERQQGSSGSALNNPE